MNQISFFRINATEYLLDSRIQSLSLEEQGAYFRLVCYAWNEEQQGTLANDDECLAHFSRLGVEKWAESKEKILKNFELVNGRWVDLKLIQEAKRQENFSEKQRAKALKRWHSPKFSSNQSIDDKKNEIKSMDSTTECHGTALTKINNKNNINKILQKKDENFQSQKSVPKDFEITEELKLWAKEKNIQQIEIRTESFLDYHRARATEFVNWQAAWRGWMLNSLTYTTNKKDNTYQSKSKTFASNFSTFDSKFKRSVSPQTCARTGKYDHLYL